MDGLKSPTRSIVHTTQFAEGKDAKFLAYTNLSRPHAEYASAVLYGTLTSIT